MDDLNPTGLPQVLDEKVSGSVTRTYAYGLQRISENQLVGGTWKPSFYGYDGHGNVRLLANTAVAVTDSYDYDAFGMIVKSNGTTTNNYLYSGERYDSSCGLYDLRARYYNQATGRFWVRDPEEGLLGLPQTLAPYPFTLNDPVNRIDPTGRASNTATLSKPAPGTEYLGLLFLIASVAPHVQELGRTIACKFDLAGTYFASVVQNALNGVSNPLDVERVSECEDKPKPPDCTPYEQAIQAAMGEVLARYQELLMDVNQLYCFAYDANNLGNRKGSWLGHVLAFQNAQRRLANAVAAAIAHHCPVPPRAWELMSMPPPICPAGRIPRP